MGFSFVVAGQCKAERPVGGCGIEKVENGAPLRWRPADEEGSLD
jgi:hypothetical protein